MPTWLQNTIVVICNFPCDLIGDGQNLRQCGAYFAQILVVNMCLFMLFGLSKAASTDAGLILTVNNYLSTQLRSSHVFTYTLPRPQIQN